MKSASSACLKIVLFLILFLFSFTQITICQEISWAEQQLQKMTLEEKIAQIIFIRMHSNKDAQYNAQKIKEIEKYQPGGVCFFQGGPVREINLTNKIQAVSKIPLMISMDAEWGVAMRLDSVPAFPRQITLGALPAKHNNLIYEMGKAVAEQCKLLGVHLNYAPCVDVNNNAKNPVINSRSFGENREWVVEKSLQYMRGMQENGVIACAKHFPGHGDTEVDSHYGLPVIKKTKEKLWETELYPFQKMIENGCEMIMVSHLNIPALDDTPGSIATTSYKIVTDLLRNEMGFNGIIITDGMEMDGLRKTYPKGAVAEIKCLQAGIDVLLLPNELSIIIPAIKKAVENGEISEAGIDEKCLRVLQMKEKWGINTFQPLTTSNVVKQLNDEKVNNLIKELETKALTLVKNEKKILPLQGKEKTGVLFIGDAENENFTKSICQDIGLPFVKVDKNIKKEDIPAALAKFSKFDQVIVLYLSTNQAPSRHYGITQTSVAFLNELGKSKKLILTLFGNPYALEQFKSLDRFDAVIVGYQRTENSTRAAFQALFGQIPFEGLLPVSVLDYKSQSNAFTEQKAKKSPSNFEGVSGEAGRGSLYENDTDVISFLPENSRREIDQMITKSIEEKVFPGCQILVYRKGKPLFVKNYGTTDYENNIPVTANTIYDVASITKPLATTLALMKLYDEKMFSLKDTIGKYVAWVAGSNKSSLSIEELLTHTSGLQAFIPFHKHLLPDSVRNFFLNTSKTDVFHIPVANRLFLNSQYHDSIRTYFLESNLRPKKYLYSDLGLLLLKEMVENIIDKPLEDYLFSEFYKPLGLENTFINPALKGIDLKRVAPTEMDTLFRLQTVHGYVHDPMSALFGGFAGNAGLFSTAYELSVILEMLMNKGTYHGKRYLCEKTVQLFTSPYFCNGTKHRALGFYTPSAEKTSEILPQQASAKTFGHQGFTGTVFWCDPAKDLIYIFLSNRVHPNVEPNLLSQRKIRLLVHEMIYEGVKEFH